PADGPRRVVRPGGVQREPQNSRDRHSYGAGRGAVRRAAAGDGHGPRAGGNRNGDRAGDGVRGGATAEGGAVQYGRSRHGGLYRRGAVDGGGNDAGGVAAGAESLPHRTHTGVAVRVAQLVGTPDPTLAESTPESSRHDYARAFRRLITPGA